VITIDEYTRQHMIEQVMARHGCGSPDPVTYRRILNGMGLSALRRALIEPPDFPAIEETTDDSHNAKRASGTPSRGVFSNSTTVQSVLP